MRISTSTKRCADGWAPVLAYDNGGRVISAIRCATEREALIESADMINCINEYPNAFANNHPSENQCIDLSKGGAA